MGKQFIYMLVGAAALGLILGPYNLPWQVIVGVGGLWACVVGIVIK